MKCFGSFGRAKHLCFAARNLSSLNITDRTQALAEGLIHHKRASLAQSITLIESKRLDHQREAEWLLEHVLRNRVDNGWREGLPTLRIGVAGPPGAGMMNNVTIAFPSFGYSFVLIQGKARLLKLLGKG